MLEAVIFDMDGVLSDSEPFYVKAMVEIVGEYGVELSDGFLASLRGMTSARTWHLVRETFPEVTADVDELVHREAEYITELYRKDMIPAVPHSLELVRALKESGLKVALATSNYLQRVKLALGNYGIEPLMDAMACCDDVERGKPAPDLFLLAAGRLGVSPEKCVVIEDAKAGVEAAGAAGMKVALFLEKGRPMPDCEPDLIVGSMAELSADVLRGMLSAV